jgi:hypothetical protein
VNNQAGAGKPNEAKAKRLAPDWQLPGIMTQRENHGNVEQIAYSPATNPKSQEELDLQLG